MRFSLCKSLTPLLTPLFRRQQSAWLCSRPRRRSLPSREPSPDWRRCRRSRTGWRETEVAARSTWTPNIHCWLPDKHITPNNTIPHWVLILHTFLFNINRKDQVYFVNKEQFTVSISKKDLISKEIYKYAKLDTCFQFGSDFPSSLLHCLLCEVCSLPLVDC